MELYVFLYFCNFVIEMHPLVLLIFFKFYFAFFKGKIF